MSYFIFIFVFFIDLLIGDPAKIPHPVVLIGNLITKLEYVLYPKSRNNNSKLFLGCLLVILVLALTYFSTWFLVHLFTFINPFLGFFVEIWLIATTIAIKGLKQEGLKIKRLLSEKKLNEARIQVGYIVGRDTTNLDEQEIIRATVETIAENIVDAITSPLFFALLGGAPLAMTYRAVNTLDSMLGYRNERYLYFGKAAARIDDAFNFLPARLTGIFLVLTAFLTPDTSGKDAFKVLLRDRTKHPSPNSGYSESAVAGALKIRLGGLNYYHGQPSKRPYIGDDIIALNIRAIDKTIQLMLYTAILWTITITFLKLFLF